MLVAVLIYCSTSATKLMSYISQAPSFDEARPHRELARAGIAILENLNLENIDDGEYELCAFPVKLGGLEAAPCRAILFEMEKGLN